MSTNPVDTLNGVAFPEPNIENGFAAGAFSYSGGVWTASQGAGGYVEPNSSTSNFGTPYYLRATVVSDTYHAASTYNGYSTSAVFGIIKLENTYNYGGAKPGYYQGTVSYYEVVGFNGHQLLLYGDGQSSPSDFTHGVYTDAQHLDSTISTFQGIKVLNDYAFLPTTNFYNAQAAAANHVTFTPPCFAEGTRVSTRRGEVAVEDLLEGDEVATASGAVRPVIWIGSRRVKVAGYPRPDEVNPILIRAGAFADGVPARDLRLSPGHAVHVDGVLVPAGHLVNGATIVQETVEAVRYFHVELDAHDVLLAEGLSCESYLDDGNREVFANSPEHTALYGRLDPADWEGACDPVVRDGARLAAIQAGLLARAEALGWVRTNQPDLRLVLGDEVLAPLHVAHDRIWFMVPRAGQAILASRAARPAEVEPGHGDGR
ncbi:MAG: Hint domain-containing protein, partial [Caulobacteraceae bacterium]